MARHVPGHQNTHRTATVSPDTARARRLTSVVPRQGESLTSAEENVLRMHHGLTVALDAALPTNAVTAALRQQLQEMESRAYEATGRAQMDMGEDEAGATPPSAKQKIVAKLRKS